MHIFYYTLMFFLLITGCKKENKPASQLSGEYIYRHHDEYFFSIPRPEFKKREAYSWEKNTVKGLPKITKDYFRCKGQSLNPVRIFERENRPKLYYRDCASSVHGLPLKEGKEFIYPCLIDLLNYVQKKTSKRVVITTGHRCPQHNVYCDFSTNNWSSKHMIGAEVDFYVESLEREPEKILFLVQQYYKEKFPGDKEFEIFQRYEKEGLNVRTPPWYNKEIFIKLYHEDEGRDLDNAHPYPYIGIQVRYDREQSKRVVFDQKLAENYLRH